ncbi:flagellar hook-length control protein FliK [Mariprofundus sp. KV]|uniref:flagellar hook-length control protein FliK n=1 Tax=Mariprofundus sp. KV TaxID=2608715 RepID=UPI00159FE981|nr:flagellar hook-length control protein FliK [Mariprofundus sp. KV]NWF36489.1 flagellar hook-length control protein FliK [Mariprofundus sp. KV]
MRTDAPQWASTLLQKSGSLPLQIISGQSAKLTSGEVMKGLVQNTGENSNAFKVVLKGEAFIVKGLPAALDGKEVAFIAKKVATATGSRTELSWLSAARAEAGKGNKATAHQAEKGAVNSAATAAGKTAGAATAQTGQQTVQQAHLLSKAPATIQRGKPFFARIDQIEQGRMTLTIQTAEGKQAKAPQGSVPAAKVQLIATQISDAKEGQSIKATLTQAGSEKPLLMIQPQPQVAGNSAAAARMQQPVSFNMQPGEQTMAVVQRRLDNGNVLLKIQGQNVEAPAPAHVKAGDALEIRMIKAPAEFQVLQLHKNIPEKAMSLVRGNLTSSATPVAQNLTTIKNLLPTMPANEMASIKGLPQLDSWMKASESSRDYPINGERLGQLIRDSGGQLESKLQAMIAKGGQSQTLTSDLKAILTQVAGDQAAAGKIQNSEVLRLITEASQQSLSRMETGQALNVLANLQGEPLRVEFPMLVGQHMINVQMAVQQHGAGAEQRETTGGSEQGYSVLFALELSGLGNLRVDANVSDNAVHARIYNEDSAVRHFIQENIHRLEERLQSLGFKEVYLLASPTRPDAEKQARFDELTSMRPASFSLLDVLV